MRVLQDFADFFRYNFFQHFLPIDVGRSEIVWHVKVKVKFQFLQL